MTNPNNITNIIPPLPIENITALSYFKPSGFVTSHNVWLGAKDGSIYVAQVSRFNNQFSFTARMQTARLNYGVNKIIPITYPFCALVHWVGGHFQPGPVQVIYPGGIRLKVAAEANNILYSNNRVIILKDSTVSVYQFQSNVLLFKEELHLTVAPQSIDICGDFLVYYGEGGYYQTSLVDSSTNKILSTNSHQPFVYTVGASKVFLGDNDFIRISELNGKDPSQLQYDRNYRIPNSMLPAPDCLYQFFQEAFTRVTFNETGTSEAQTFNIPDVSQAVMVKDCLLILTPKSLQLIGTMEDPMTLGNKVLNGKSDEIHKLLESLPKEQSSAYAITIFNNLWSKGKTKEAAQFLSNNPIITSINHVISLIPVLMTTGEVTHPEGSENLKPLRDDDKSLVEPIMNFLALCHDKLRPLVKYSSEYYKANTVLAECYAAQSKTRELDALIKENKLDMIVFQQFLSKRETIFNLTPARAVFMTNADDIEGALRIWHQVDDILKAKGAVNPLFISEASYTLQHQKDSTNLANELDWIYERDPHKPELVLNAILSINHDSQIVENWIASTGLDNLKLRYSVFIVTNSATSRGSSLANETFITLLGILNQIDNSEFDLQQLQFTQAFIENSQDPQVKEKAKEEIVQYELQILKQHAPSVIQEDVKPHLNDQTDKRIIYALYRVKEEYETGIQLLTANDQFPRDEIEEFCRCAPNSNVAFSVLLKSIPQEELIGKYYDFVKDNIIYMDLAELVSLLPRTAKVKQVQELLKMCYNLLYTRLYNLDDQIAISKSMKVDLRYQKVRALSHFCVLDANSVCAACGEPILDGQAFAMAPCDNTKEFYHINCKPVLI